MKRRLMNQKRMSGFSVIEVLVSLVLVLMVVIMVTRMISAAFGGYRNAREAFLMHQRMDEFRNRMLSEAFDSAKWLPGDYSLEEPRYVIDWRIRRVTDGLKRASLSVRRKRTGVTRQSGFYKSRHIRAGW